MRFVWINKTTEKEVIVLRIVPAPFDRTMVYVRYLVSRHRSWFDKEDFLQKFRILQEVE